MRSKKKIAAALQTAKNSATEPEARLKACDTLVKFGFVDLASPVLHDLASDPAIAGRARLLQRTGEYLVRRGLVNEESSIDGFWGRSYQPAISDDANTAFWRSPEPQRASENLVIVFTGTSKQFGISLDLLHRILRHFVGQVLYLRDSHDIFYLAGVDSWGNYEKTLERLKGIVGEASVRKLYIIGSSAGGYGALKYGLDLSADAILALSPKTDLRQLPEQKKKAILLKRFRISIDALDVVPAYNQAQRRPHVTIVYGGKN